MMEKMPYTPFSTHLSGSAKEIRMRLEHIASGPKKRPPALFLALVFAACLLCGNLVSCQVTGTAEAPVQPLSDRREPAAPPAVDADSQARAAYTVVLEDMLWRDILPDGTQVSEESMSGYMFENTFAIADVDGDGREELVIRFTTALAAGYRSWVLDYDQSTDSVRIQYEGSPSLTFYTNGAMAENDSHAQGSWTADFWPHTLYTYRPEADSYEIAGHVDAWEKVVSDANPGNLPPFPVEKDESGAGILYYITPAEDIEPNFNGYSKDLVDRSVYLDWLEPILGDAQPLLLDFRTLPDAADYLRSQTIPADSARPGLSRTPDWNRNGVPERFVLLEEADGDLTLEIWENGQRLCQKPGQRSYPSSLFLCTLEGVDYLLDYSVYEEQGTYRMDYRLETWKGEFTENARWNSISFDLNFGTPFHKDFDPEAIADFVDELNELLAHSELLFSTDPGLPETGREDLSRLEGVAWDSGSSLRKNLEDLKGSMPPDWTPPAAQAGTQLPIDEPLSMTFASGVGAWSTELTLEADGSFTGLFVDSDMGVDGPDYPGGTRYVCQFHGKFHQIAPITGSSWYMTLEELTLDTGRPIGEKWIEDEVLYISSAPYGFDNDNGPLQPGAAFLFYTPDAQGHAPGTELYGACEFWTWWPNRHVFYSASDTLGCYGLHNLEMGDGFFT